MPLRTDYDFTLPKGYVDEEGNLHRNGTMRLAIAADEIVPMKDPRVLGNPAYLTIIVLSRVVTQLGELEDVTPAVIERLFVGDLVYLQDLYSKINGPGSLKLEVTCPECGKRFEQDIAVPGRMIGRFISVTYSIVEQGS